MRNTASPTSNRVYGREKYLISCSMAQWSRGLFLEGPDNFSGPKFMFAVFVFKMKVSVIILKMIQ